MIHSAITISVARVADAVGIQDVYYRGWLEAYPNEELGISTEDIEEWHRRRYSEETLQSLKARLGGPLSTEVTFVARSCIRIVGVCHVRRHTERNELQSLYVLRSYIGKGVGSQLWAHARDYLDPQKATYLEVATYNAKAIAFYERQGFAAIGKKVTDSKFRFKSGAVLPTLTMRRPESRVVS